MRARPKVGVSFTHANNGREIRLERRCVRMKVLIGVDPHKATVAVAAVDEVGELIECASFPQNRAGLRALERWAKRFPERRWAVENAGGLGKHLSQRLAAAGESVVDVPPKLSARVRVLSTGNARKNDGLDALATALAAWRNERLPTVDPEAASEVLRLLSERREDLVAERTRAFNRLHGLLRDLVPGGVTGTLSTPRVARILRGIRPQGTSARPPVVGFGDPARRPGTGAKDRRPRWAHRSRGRSFRHQPHRDLWHRSHTGRQDHRDGRQCGTFPDQGPLCLLLRHGAGGGFEWGVGKAQAFAGGQPSTQQRPAHGRSVPG